MSAIPENLMERLRVATENFRKARMSADGVGRMSNEQKASAGAALRAAEKELEEVTSEINKFLPTTAPADELSKETHKS